MSSAHRQHGFGRSGGFTLVELLVVIAIISLLMGIVLPSLKGARDTAKTMHCSVNLRSIGQALQLYADDYEEWYPYTTGWHTWEGDGTGADNPGPGWTEQMREYMTSQEVYVDKARPPGNPFAYFLQARYPLGLRERSGIPVVPGEPLSVRAPSIFFTSQFVLAGDNNTPVQYPEPYGIALNPPDCDMDDGETDCAFPSIEPLRPHNGLVNLLMTDGHVDAFRKYEEGRITWHGQKMLDWQRARFDQ
ncbi:MAG: type II secretion system protein [Phycisphaerales bacterium]